MNLNPKQQAVATSLAKKILCIAGPGSGKTVTLCARIFHLVSECGAWPGQMVVITFTNAAADELQKRLCAMYGLDSVKFGYIGTLHGFLMRLISAQAQLIRLPNTMSVIDEEQKVSLLESIMAEMRVKCPTDKILPLLKTPSLIEGVRSASSRTKEQLVAIEYHSRLRQNALLDFDTILYYGHKLIKQLDGWSYKFLFVDEFQDSADEDAAIYRDMPCENKFIVGDPDQSVYSFRGGNVNNILELAYGGEWALLELEDNYRCSKIICEHAQQLIEKNDERVPKVTKSDKEGGNIKTLQVVTAGMELSNIHKTITQFVSGSCAVLWRTNALAKQCADYLRNLGVPVVSKKVAVNPAGWTQAKALLTLMANPHNDLAAFRYLSLVSGNEYALNVKHAASKAMKGINEFNPIVPSLVNLPHVISDEAYQKIMSAIATVSKLRPDWTINDVIFELNKQIESAGEIGGGVVVTTFHSAKGREWETVFIGGAEQNVTPGKRADVKVEEERRLFYVALTRAEKFLFISSASERTAVGRPWLTEPTGGQTQFVKEMTV